MVWETQKLIKQFQNVLTSLLGNMQMDNSGEFFSAANLQEKETTIDHMNINKKGATAAIGEMN